MLKGFRIVGLILLVIIGNLYRVLLPEEGLYNWSMPKPMSFQETAEEPINNQGNIFKNTAKPATPPLQETISSTARLLKTPSSRSNNQAVETPQANYQVMNHRKTPTILSGDLRESEVLKGGNSIIFVETTNRLHPPSLVLCALESAARVYKDRPVLFFMKGLRLHNQKDVVKTYFPTLACFKNVYFFPLRMMDVFSDTPLISWYLTVNPRRELYWIHVAADGCRLALIWKYGGFYMDSDIISLRRVPHDHFLAAQGKSDFSNAAFGFSSHDEFIWRCMEDFVQNYNGKMWGHQGPRLVTRVMNESCTLPDFAEFEDPTCGNITFLHPDRFYPIPFYTWKLYFEVWGTEPSFEDCYGVHLWNYKIQGQRTMTPGSNELVEHLYQRYCPTIYADLRNETAT